MGRILGIDLGTTNSVMSIMEKNGPVIVPNSLGERVTPSVVGFTKSGEILVGKKAKRAAIMNVGRTVFSIKRHMGTNYRVRIEGKEYTPQEISAMILQKMKQDAEDFYGEEINQAVICCPAYFTDAQRQATKDAGEIAGLKVRRIIDEPTSSALAYGIDKSADQVILVFDFGGGTFDVSIIEVVSGVFQVLAIQGNTHLGGDDFDKRIVEFLVEEFKKSHGVDLSEDPIAMQRLKEAGEEAKIELSEVKESHILVEAITMTEKGPLSLDYTLTRQKLESLVENLVEQTRAPVLQAIEDAALSLDKIDTILLVGGTTRMPAVQRLVKEITKKEPRRDISPDEVVSLGGAVQTLALAPIEGDLEDTLAARYGKEKPVIIHMTPFSLGVGLEHDQFSVIIERNSTYPTEAKDIFTTTHDFQEAISFPIYEGEENIASENTFLDLLRIEGITPAPRGVPRVEVTFRLNPDRILEARAEDLATGVEKKITIAATDARLSESEKQRMVKESKDRVSRSLRERIQENRIEESQSVLSRSEEVLANYAGHPMESTLRKKTEDLRSLMQQGGGDDRKLGETIDDVNRLITIIETAAG
ncbi:MAG TPA: Hsp70 family protein [Candidatus Sumerlaeota bacterium]|nr:MAG: Chaperone protein DnaK [candidate division BRC1 bacterium ADurb.Bin183]HOE62479.1 Hsp70 family protein [Candidatus Sumerlaeota bacterium]HRR31412.1 Hsp70 family protein [Candidatus Sumerlaeia bacterium]HON50080.1 Hsp70 family protein [Candidatus Sumerlaeota bacterium]HOR63296.1 Hsp70 family protein [Candidatus Sumerlaeota bacterium]